MLDSASFLCEIRIQRPEYNRREQQETILDLHQVVTFPWLHEREGKFEFRGISVTVCVESGGAFSAYQQ